MKDNYTVNQLFEKINYAEVPLAAGEYGNCRFMG